MSLPAMLDVAIGVIFLFLILSLVVTAINELIASFLKLRAKGLRGGMERLIGNEELTDLLRNTGIFQIGKASKSTVGPSYVSGRNFALAVIEAVENKQKLADGFADVVATVERLPPGKFRDALVTVTKAAAAETDAQLKAIADYFDEAMERATGLYKRWMKIWSLVIGIVLAVVINADAFHVGKALWSDDALRSQVTEAALQIGPLDLQNPDGGQSFVNVQKNLELLRPFPVGWGATELRVSGQSVCNQWDLWLSKIIGLIITGAAVTLGAPFWFDLLSRFTRIRSSGGLETESAKK